MKPWEVARVRELFEAVKRTEIADEVPEMRVQMSRRLWRRYVGWDWEDGKWVMVEREHWVWGGGEPWSKWLAQMVAEVKAEVIQEMAVTVVEAEVKAEVEVVDVEASDCSSSGDSAGRGGGRGRHWQAGGRGGGGRWVD